ncbi:MAG: GTPase ObgE [Acidimicrobiia bacterium]|nr:GTPase ObgE [Acidimicrobiia bacterium]
MASGFVDEAQLHVRAGDGGAGAVSFRREAHVPRGGPDGGDGGNGGDVWLVADRNVASLLGFKDHPFRRATNGVHGQGAGRHGANGADSIVPVPEGTTVKEKDGTVIADLLLEGDRWLAARGGRGGRGNARFLNNRRRAPSFAEQGEPGEERWLDMELRLIADVALVGFPNAGKSTLISRISAAKPKVASYPFTTLQPHLGVVRMDESEIVVADVPGLIEGAAEGRGLGHQFLRHVERARALLVLVDLASVDEIQPAEQERVLLDELRRYKPELLDRPRITVGTKTDVATMAWEGDRISAVTGDGVRSLVGRLITLVEEARAAEPVADSFVLHEPLPEGFHIERDPTGDFRVVGRPAERAVALSDLTNADAQEYVRQRLQRLGVDRALERAGAREGDTVHIGDMEFEYQPAESSNR